MKSNTTLDYFFNTITLPVAAIDMLNGEYVITNVNSGFKDYFAIDITSIINKKAIDFFNNCDIVQFQFPDLTQLITATFRDKSLHTLKCKNDCKENENFTIDALPYYDDNGKAIVLLLFKMPLTDNPSVPNADNEKAEEQKKLKLLESVAIHTNDAILITKAEPFRKPGPEIIYVNDAFTKMTGYTMEEVLGKTPRILQGPKSDYNELKKLSAALRSWQSCDITLINYKKNGEEFWVNISITPVADESGRFTHWIAIQRDITEKKNEEEQKSLITTISQIFNNPTDLPETLTKTIERITSTGNYCIGEIWILSNDKKQMNLLAKYAKNPKMEQFYQNTTSFKTAVKGQGLPGKIWENNTFHFWKIEQKNSDFIRKDAAKEAGLQTVYGIPLVYNDEVNGVLILGAQQTDKISAINIISENFGSHLGAEIKRKQLELELTQIFSLAPDVLCIADFNGYFRKINPAACELLEYTEQELLSVPFIQFVHPEDRHKTASRIDTLSKGNPTRYFENRYITKSGKIRWFAWTSTTFQDEKLIFAVAKDITENKNLERLLENATNRARIGSWELDVEKQTVFFSDMARDILEIRQEAPIDIKSGMKFYKKGKSRNTIKRCFVTTLIDGSFWDEELAIITANGNERWIRNIGQGEMVNGQCTRVFGSMQDIDARKRAELALEETNKKIAATLESIQDGFYALDDNWTVTYWNKEAENLLMTRREDIIGKILWEAFPPMKKCLFHPKYHKALHDKIPVRFEEYFEPLERWLDISAFPSENGLTVYFKDITDKKITLNKLKASEKRYSDLFHLSPQPMWVYDSESYAFLDVNIAAIQHYGYCREEFLAMTIKEIRPVEDAIHLREAIERSRTINTTLYHGAFRHKKKNGEIIQVQIDSNDIQFLGGKARIVLATDVTERLKYVATMEKQNEKLREIAWIQSHIVRAPLANMMGLIDALQNFEISETQRQELLNYIIKSAIELDVLIKEILAKSEQVSIDTKGDKND